jgi:hypothetical protein
MTEEEQPEREAGTHQTDHVLEAEPGSYAITGQPAGLSISSDPAPGLSPTTIPRDPAAKAALEDLRLGELTTVQKGLGQMCRRQREERWWRRVFMVEWDRVFGTLALLLWGAVIGGGIGFIPFREADPSQTMHRVYIAALAIVGLLALFASLARMGVKSKEMVSLVFLYEHVTDIIDSFSLPKPSKRRDESA